MASTLDGPPLSVNTRMVYGIPATKPVNSTDVTPLDADLVCTFPTTSSSNTVYPIQIPEGANHFTLSELIVRDSNARFVTAIGTAKHGTKQYTNVHDHRKTKIFFANN